MRERVASAKGAALPTQGGPPLPVSPRSPARSAAWAGGSSPRSNRPLILSILAVVGAILVLVTMFALKPNPNPPSKGEDAMRVNKSKAPVRKVRKAPLPKYPLDNSDEVLSRPVDQVVNDVNAAFMKKHKKGPPAGNHLSLFSDFGELLKKEEHFLSLRSQGLHPTATKSWFPELFSATTVSEVESGFYLQCRLGGAVSLLPTGEIAHPPEVGTNSTRPYRQLLSLHPLLFNATTYRASEYYRYRRERAMQRDSELSNVVFLQPLTEVVNGKDILDAYFAERKLTDAKEQAAAVQELLAKRSPQNPLLEARYFAFRGTSEHFQLRDWHSESKVHYSVTPIYSAERLCHNTPVLQVAKREERRRQNAMFLRALTTFQSKHRATGSGQPTNKEGKEPVTSGLTNEVLKALFMPQSSTQQGGLEIEANGRAGGKDGVQFVDRHADGTGTQKGPGSSVVEQAALLKKVRTWDPVCTFQRLAAKSSPETYKEGNRALSQLFLKEKPTLLCVITTYMRRMRLAFLQHQLWAHRCDDYIIVVADVGKRIDRKNREKLDKELGEYALPIDPSRVIFLKSGLSVHEEHQPMEDPLSFLLSAQDDSLLWEEASNTERTNAWQVHRELMGFLTMWHLSGSFDYVYFAPDTAYAVPENIYEMLMVEPAYSVLHMLGTPLFLGHRMKLPKTSEYYIAGPSGYLLNSHAIRYRNELLEHEKCFPDAESSSEDVLLAKCLRVLSLHPKDTVDEIGEDRFLPISLEWLIKTSVQPSSSWWYPYYRTKPMPGATADATLMRELQRTQKKSDRQQQAANLAFADVANDWFRQRSGDSAADRPSHVKHSVHAISSSAIAFGYITTLEKAYWIHRELHGERIH